MFGFFYELFTAFRGIDWFLLILLGMTYLLSFFVGFTQIFSEANSSDTEVDTFMHAFMTHTRVSLYAYVVIYCFVVFENEKMFSVVQNTHFLIPYLVTLAVPVLGLLLHVATLLLGGFSAVLVSLLYSLCEWLWWKITPVKHQY